MQVFINYADSTSFDFHFNVQEMNKTTKIPNTAVVVISDSMGNKL